MWLEEDSRDFIDYGRYFVPDRDRQIAIIRDIIPDLDGPFLALDLCCGEGLLSEAILDRFPDCTVRGLDGSLAMRQAAERRLARFGGRFESLYFDLADQEWRDVPGPLKAIVSSLCVHHLDGGEKRSLFADSFRLLAPGGALVIADLIEPAGRQGTKVAAAAWDEAVRQQARQLDGDERAFDRFRELGWNHFRTPDPTDQPSTLIEQLNWLAEAGFGEVDVYWLRAGHAIFGGRRLA